GGPGSPPAPSINDTAPGPVGVQYRHGPVTPQILLHGDAPGAQLVRPALRLVPLVEADGLGVLPPGAAQHPAHPGEGDGAEAHGAGGAAGDQAVVPETGEIVTAEVPLGEEQGEHLGVEDGAVQRHHPVDANGHQAQPVIHDQGAEGAAAVGYVAAGGVHRERHRLGEAGEPARCAIELGEPGGQVEGDPVAPPPSRSPAIQLAGHSPPGRGRANRKPWWMTLPRALRKSAWAGVSTPSATTARLRWRAMARMVSTSTASSRSSGRSWTKLLSIFTSRIGRRLR